MRSILLFLASLTCLAAEPAGVEALIGAARSAPPEFAADALIRLGGVSKLDRQQRIAIVQEAFQDAGAAREPYKRRFATIQGGGPSRFFNQVYSQELDRLSLQVRAVEAMLSLDSRKARVLFEQIAPPDLPRLTCDDFLVYDVSRVYDLLGRVVNQGFSAAEIARRDHLRLLVRYVAISSPAQIGPAARLIASAGMNERDFQDLAASFAAALRGISGDDRSYTASTDAGPQIRALAKECENRHMSPAVVLEAYRAYLVNHLSATRCADSVQGSGSAQAFGMVAGGASAPQGGDALGFFNDSLAGGAIQPIGAEEATPSKVEGAVPAWRLCEDAACRDVVSRYRALVMTPPGIPYSAAEKSGMEWKDKLDGILASLASWKESDGVTSSQFFREKAEIYSDLFGVVSDSDGQERVARANLAFLSQSRFRTDNPLEWFLPVSVLIGRTRLDPRILASLAEDIRRNGDALIGLYADLEKIAPRVPESILGLM